MSRANTPLNLLSHLRHTSQISRLLAEAKRRAAEQSRLQELLPPALRDQVALSVDDDCLHARVGNNAIAQMLHFHQPQLLQASACKRLSISIRPAEHQPASQPAKVERQLSAASAQLLLDAADDFEDQTLADNFRRLAQHTRQPNIDS